MNAPFEIRVIRESDAAATLEIYKPYVLHSAVTFEYEVPSVEDFSERIKTITQEYPWLVVLHNGIIVGYGYAHKHRIRTAYQWSPELSIYLANQFQSNGIGSILYETLFAILKLQGFHNVYAGVSLPNDQSLAFHRKLGFAEVGIFKKIGYKHGQWLDTHWFQKQIHEPLDPPPSPLPIHEIRILPAFQEILLRANQQLNGLPTNK